MIENVISRRDFLRRFAAGAAAAAMPAGLQGGNISRKRPNILFLLADDQRSDSIGAYGNEHITTPNIDKLVAQGFSFRRNYCLGSNGGAVCVPSRAMINSGRAYFNVDSTMKGVKIMPELLRENGYTTFATGKWHNKEESFLRGFEKGRAIFFGGMADHTRVPVVDLSPEGQFVKERTGKEFSSELFTNAAIEFLENYRQDKPFFAYVAFTAPHDPRNPPMKYRQMYYKDRPPLPRNFMPQHPFDNGHMTGRDESLAAWPRTEDVVRDQLAEYYGLVTHLDEHIGRVLKALKESPHADNTIIVYAADHGLALGSHGLLGKQSIYEHSMGCPLIFAGPGIPKGGSTQAFSYLLDIFPTVCGLTGIRPPAGVEGKDLRPIWEGNADKARDSVFLSFAKVQRSVRDERWKLIRYPKIDHTQLFDLKNDPDELHDLAGEPAQAERVQRMLHLLKESQQKVGDDLPLTVADPDPKEIDMTDHAREPDRWQPEWIRKKYFGPGKYNQEGDDL
ncbi:MAG TPA: sulfatase-like hydrolase/transferase [Sedimentisphaerales bacterium]|nr:sulfatase-like hydrolase/transferase [Sedimentisphaerales bacterium]